MSDMPLYTLISLGSHAPYDISLYLPNNNSNCNLIGFNCFPGPATSNRVRIGIVTNQENDCGSCDSRIGFGGGGNYCGANDGNTCG